MKLTDEINSALSRIVEEDHIVQNGVRDALFDSVGPLFDTESTFFPLRPSSCLKPLRDLYYDLCNFYKPGSIPKAPLEARIKLIFQFGHLTETLLKKVFAYTYGVVAEQERVTYGYVFTKAVENADGTVIPGEPIPLTGSIDWASTVGGPVLVLCDAKSIGDFPFKKAPKAENIAQMQLYMHSDWGRRNDVNRAMLIYFNKNTSDIKVIEVGYEPLLAQKLLERLQLVYNYYLEGTVPPREFLAGLDWQADYGSYKDYDNLEFAENAMRENFPVPEYYEAPKNAKAALRQHVEKYGNKRVIYLDKQVEVVYNQGKLELLTKEI